MEVVPGIHKVDGTWGGNVYLLDGGDSLTQVDAALPFNGRRIRRYIQSMGRTVSDVRQLVLTHAHPDHTGSIHSLFGDSGVPTLVHEADTLRSGSGRRLYYRGQLFSLPGKLPLCSRIPAHSLLADGAVLAHLPGVRVLHTPGHTAGSVCLLDEERGVLIAGDMLISDGKSFHRPVQFPGTDFRAYRRSIERIVSLDFDTVCAGHGKPVVGGAKASLERMLTGYTWALFPWRFIPRPVLRGRGRGKG